MPDRRLWNATLEIDMPDWRPIKDRHAPLVTDIPHRRLTCLIGDISETSTCRWVSDQVCLSPVVLRSGMLVSSGSPNRHVGVSNKACQGLRSGMPVSD